MSGHPSSLGQPRRRRRVRGGGHAVEEGGAERWLVTYADMLTLLLVLFIVLFSMSVVNTSKFEQLKASLAAAFGEGPKSVLNGGKSVLDGAAAQKGTAQLIPGAPAAPFDPQNGRNSDAPSTTVTTTNLATLADEQIHNFKKIEKAVNKALDKHGMSGAVQFSMDRRGLVMTVVTNALVFGGNSATLLPEGRRILSVIAPQLVDIPNQIAVNGYTNQLPASTYPYPSGWELSSARASAVVRALIHRGIAEARLSATGYNDLDPLIDPDNPKAATRNRRVDIVVMSTLPDTAGDALQSELDADGSTSTASTTQTGDTS
jgi:chemotaxis protein MotB